jgi:hypothetical protein
VIIGMVVRTVAVARTDRYAKRPAVHQLAQFDTWA